MADRRFGDAEALVTTGENARANGAHYLAGIVVKILLKGRVLRKRPYLHRPGLVGLTAEDRPIADLIWRSHDLNAMLAQLPDVSTAVRLRAERSGVPLNRWLREVCSTWTIFARNSPQTSTIAAAGEMVDRVRALKEVI